MKAFTLTFFVTIVLHLVVGVGGANALPKCTNSYYRHNCEDTVLYANGDKYVGAFKDYLPHGQGTYHLADNHFKGNKYVGAWKDDKRHGQGTYLRQWGQVRWCVGW